MGNASTSKSLADKCPICQYPSSSSFLRLERVPIICNVLYSSASDARQAPCSGIDLVACERCGVIYNANFDPAIVQYTPGYQNPLHVSERFRSFAKEMSANLVKNHRLLGGTAIEIGCGDGFFLKQLVESGMHKGIGYDPALGEGTAERIIPGVRIFPELFNFDQSIDAVDVIICRHVLEHLAKPTEVLTKLRRNIGVQDTLMYFEVPNAAWMLESVMVWDVIFEHFTYWTSAALSALFVRCGFNTLSASTGFENQFLMLEARPRVCPSERAWPISDQLRIMQRQCDDFGKMSTKLISDWKTELRNLRAHGRKAIIWGAGSKGTTFANVVAGNEPLLAGIIDINPEKQGKYAAFSGLPVLAPSQLKDLRPDIVILMNENYAPEVTRLLKEISVTADLRKVSQFSNVSHRKLVRELVH